MDKFILETNINQGLTSRKIAKLHNCSQCKINYWLKKYDLHTKSIPYNHATTFCCKHCGEIDPSKFYKRSRADGQLFRHSVCSKCENSIRGKRLHKWKAKAVEYKGGKCIMCGYNKCLGSLHFHHENGDLKSSNWRNLRACSFDKWKTELDKCILVCSNCHGEIHWGSKN